MLSQGQNHPKKTPVCPTVRIVAIKRQFKHFLKV
uniref:Uncharacterized protein n=1 Tax=Anguilla anguilla TaxID=7936 RepID=A0A0E9PU52_ANGAN